MNDTKKTINFFLQKLNSKERQNFLKERTLCRNTNKSFFKKNKITRDVIQKIQETLNKV
jgi:hypothetical protein